MSSSLRKSFLAAILASAAVITGCSQKPDTQGSQLLTRIQNRINSAAETALSIQETKILGGASGCRIVRDRGVTDTNFREEDACDYTITKVPADGIAREVTFHPLANALDWKSCHFLPTREAEANEKSALDAFNADAAKKFGKMGFTVVDTMAAPTSTLVPYYSQCSQYTGADFLLKSGGKYYSAQFNDIYSFEDRTVSGQRVTNLQAVDAPKMGR